MALITCTECGREISDTASECVNCGTPTQLQRDKFFVQPSTQTRSRRQSIGTPLWLLPLIMATAGVMAAVLLSVAMDSVDSSFNFHGSERVDDLVGHVVRQAESDVALLGDRGPAMRDDNAG